MSRRTQFRENDEEASRNFSPNEHSSLLGKSKRKANSAWNTTRAFLRLNYCNILLPIVPVALVFGFLDVNPVAIFVLNFLAIVPLASVLSDATEELAEHVGHTLGGLLNATFGNATELIISIFALKKGEIRIVQASMLGSILSNMLLVLGMCFFFGGLGRSEQTFNNTAASTMASLMAVASASLIIPAALYQTMALTKEPNFDSILLLSRATAIVILILYLMYIYFQFYSHHRFFTEDGGTTQLARETESQHTNGGSTATTTPSGAPQDAVLTRNQAAVVLFLATVIVSICADYLVKTIDNIVDAVGLSKTFIGLILIPIVGNAAEHVTSVVVAMEDKMNLAVNIAIGSGLQIALLVTPLLVILGWIIGQPMSLYFQTFETVVFFVSVLVANFLILDGKSNYLEGAMLIGIYAIIAVSFYVYPDNAVNNGFGPH
ncbi:calcium/proton exchanger family protein [Terfezia boudieri ATCC MYA-4762]|uniref:Vacuolar calcium ion transporter n=1 Tax=Terfezia boudieri ATCC MYA-4762 TaxID=1051890 RepID=A0A3N4LIQ2_9PEZI|nr:calcium/proton exchanger family protein [Terfezia boudieri ATCC MYA-4762]